MSTHETVKASAPAKPFALVGYFNQPNEIYHACEAVRDAGYKDFDAHTPFPVHGLENAMGLKPSRLPWIVLACAITGFSSALLMMIWMTVIDYPLIIGGKPALTLPSYVPIAFELTVLFSAFGCFFGMWGLNRLPLFFHPVMRHPNFGRASDDRFFISIEASDPNYDTIRTRQFLEGIGAREVAEVLS
jgi:hypothetical protein